MYEYTKEKLYMIVETLSTWKWDIRDRLIDVETIFWRLNKEDFPKEMQNDFEWVAKECEKFWPEYSFSVINKEWKEEKDIILSPRKNTIKRIKNKTWEKIAKKIRNWYIKIEGY